MPQLCRLHLICADWKRNGVALPIRFLIVLMRVSDPQNGQGCMSSVLLLSRDPAGLAAGFLIKTHVLCFDKSALFKIGHEVHDFGVSSMATECEYFPRFQCSKYFGVSHLSVLSSSRYLSCKLTRRRILASSPQPLRLDAAQTQDICGIMYQAHQV